MNIYKNYCLELESLGLIRDTIPGNSGCALDFSSVSYLCLHNNEDVKLATIEAVKTYGVGATGSRIVSGNYQLCHDLERTVSQDKMHEDALLFVSGYNANCGLLRALCDDAVTKGRNVVVFFDKMNHASLYHGCLATKARILRYCNADLENLEDLLVAHCDPNNINIVVSETVFGVNGKIIDIDKIYELSKKYGAMLVLDEAHDVGMLGNKGLGITTSIALDEDIFVTGSFGKAIGVVGGYVLCSTIMRRYLVQKSGTVMYSNNIPPHVVAAIHASWQISKTKEMSHVRSKILYLSSYIQMRLFGKFNGTNIFALDLGSRDKFDKYLEVFRQYGIVACFFRPPTTPTYSIKVAINASHDLCDIKRLLKAFEACFKI